MASEYSFDIVSQIDRQELANALDQVRKEIATRYDFKDVPVEIVSEKEQLVLHVPDEYKLTAVLEIISSKLIRRGLDLKILGEQKKESASGGTLRVTIKLTEGISGEHTKTINKLIRDHLPKVKSNIQGDTIRVVSKSKDELQEVMQLLKTRPEVTIPLQFINYR